MKKVALYSGVLFGALACAHAQMATTAPRGGAAPDTTIHIADDASVAAFQKASADKAAAALKKFTIVAPGKDGWLFFAPELRHVGAGKFWGDAAAKVSQSSFAKNADPLPAILDFKAQLDRAGIELLLVPVPPKSLIYANQVAPVGPVFRVRLDAPHREFYELLRTNSVGVLDLTDDFLARRYDSFDSAGPLYCRQDTHWSGRACVLAAQRIAAAIKDRAWLMSQPKKKYDTKWQRQTISGDLWQALLTRPKPPRESLVLRFVGTPYQSKVRPNSGVLLQPVAPDKSSPIVLLGDSHDLVFHDGGDMHTRGAGLPDQLAHELGFAVDLIAVRGSGATPARTELLRRARANPKYLAGKKLVIWCFSAREFTESLGWQKVPVVP